MKEEISKKGIAGAGLGENPLTIWLLTACIVVYLYIRRSNLGIDLHPAEKKAVTPAPKETGVKLTIPHSFPILPPVGVDWSKVS